MEIQLSTDVCHQESWHGFFQLKSWTKLIHPVPGGYCPKCVGKAALVPRNTVIPLRLVEISGQITSTAVINP